MALKNMKQKLLLGILNAHKKICKSTDIDASMSHPVLKNKTRIAICVPRMFTHTTIEAMVSETMLYNGNIL
jgi:hypothetical protein